MQQANYLLLVIDLLNDYFRQQARLAALRDQIAAAVNRLAAAFRQYQQPVIWVRQEFAPDLTDAFLDMRRNNLRVTIAGTDG
jgi:nicotinamidase-related amidase